MGDHDGLVRVEVLTPVPPFGPGVRCLRVGCELSADFLVQTIGMLEDPNELMYYPTCAECVDDLVALTVPPSRAGRA